ncbi:MAG TPA: FliH/SctL family protein [Syntrophorhabdaceae bacterium]|mgnify:FL=1|jgi:flagellar biosynthesis/type III secretory pathway protein FliH|nr:MAG: flagellar assembly protein H [Deltaproteobacteria bacterium ADurb.Bin026]HOG39579.1 FliH/SctL family protein [Syntrophorhabdaceae bacterium]HPH42540.1 FliH/SctL family protein [Syntrophorhabdaceae bacterium]HPN98561.1 FliH/SctL family protein [Syntrophorhabdaceae bacterium]
MRNLYNKKNVRPFTLNPLSDTPFESKEDSVESFFKTVTFDNEDNNEDKQHLRNDQDIEAETRRIFEDAFKEGEKAGFDMGMKKIEALARRLNQDLSALSAFKKELLDKTEKLSVELALIFAEAVVLKECENNRDIIIEMAKKALDICEEKQGITIRIRKDDFKFISEEVINSLKIVSDDTLKEPGFIIESNFGDIDGTISVQIEEIKKEFLKEYADR